MQARHEALLALSALAVLVAVAGVLGKKGGSAPDEDRRPSTFLAGPQGARALLEATRGLGISVRRFRERPGQLGVRLADGTRQTLAIIGPSYPFSPPEQDLILAFSRQADLLLAGSGAESLMRCFGYRVKERAFDSLPAVPPGRAPGRGTPWVQGYLEATHEAEAQDSTRAMDVGRSICRVPPVRSVDTLLVAPGRGPVVLRLHRADVDHHVILLAEAGLLRNRALRSTDAGPFALGLFQGRADRVVFEEYHHGFGETGSLAGAALAWSRRSPWGWAAWQVAVVGILALLFGAFRFGEARPGIPRQRRSPLEHVRALAVALSAAQGQDEAIGAIVRGLRRRLVSPALRGKARSDWRSWLAQLDQRGSTPAVRASLASLNELTRPGQPPSSVLRAANAVEDVWQDLKP